MRDSPSRTTGAPHRNLTHSKPATHRLIGPTARADTLLEIITGPQDRPRIARSVRPSLRYYDQETRALDEGERVMTTFARCQRIETPTLVVPPGRCRKFLFPGAAQYAPIAKLSGGERRRLYLLRVLMNAPNVLILDEPTNDLDIQTMVTLEDYLDGFNGCLIVVSHDRYFLDRTVEHIFRFEEGGRVREYPGNYTAFLEARQKQERRTISRTVSAAASVGWHRRAACKRERRRRRRSVRDNGSNVIFHRDRELRSWRRAATPRAAG